MGTDPSFQSATNEDVVQDSDKSPQRETSDLVYTSMEMNVQAEEDGQLLNQQNSEGWVPDNIAFLLAFFAMSPYLSFICYKMHFTAIFYLSFNFLSIPLAFAIRDKNVWVRWFIGLFTIGVMSAVKTAAMIVSFEDDPFAIKCMLYTFTALWDCSNVVYIFGGRSLLDRYGIISTRRAFFAVFCPVQIKFIDSTYPSDRLFQRFLHIASYILAAFALTFLLRFVVDVQFIEKYAVLEAEALVILLSCSVNIWNIPPYLYQLAVMRYPVQIIYPYGSIYFATSSRDFWSRWSRPASTFVRHMYFYPLQGNRRAWLSIPVMFLLNASGHYSLSEVLVGNKAEVGWNIVFGALGLAATFEVCGNQYFERRTIEGLEGTQTNRTEVPKWWYWIRFVVASVVLRVAAYVFVHKCLNSSLSSWVNYQKNL